MVGWVQFGILLAGTQVTGRGGQDWRGLEIRSGGWEVCEGQPEARARRLGRWRRDVWRINVVCLRGVLRRRLWRAWKGAGRVFDVFDGFSW